jgi:hypothetical protein
VFEQARNLSQLIGNKETILDPRYTPTGGLKMLPITDLKGMASQVTMMMMRDPSKYFIVYETGDNTTVAEGEAVPLDLFYSRATNWGDDYDLVEYYNSGTGEITWASTGWSTTAKTCPVKRPTPATMPVPSTTPSGTSGRKMSTRTSRIAMPSSAASGTTQMLKMAIQPRSPRLSELSMPAPTLLS